MKRLAGLTLIELLVALAMSAVIAAALSRAFYTVIHYEMTAPASREAMTTQINFEDRLTAILQAAYLSPTTTDETTYLIGTTAGQDPNGSPDLTAAQAAPGTAAATATTSTSNTTSGQSATPNIGGTSDGIVLTCLGHQIPPNYLEATGVALTDDTTQNGPTGGTQNFQQLQSLPNGQTIEEDLTTLNNDYGTQGGVEEISITKTPVGDPGQFSDDIYMRIQRPGDMDYTQGGKEQVFDPSVDHMTFEFFDGLQWDGGWDTTTGNGRHLPGAIRVHYWLKSDPNTEHIFVVRIPLSDLTPANPLSTTATTTTTISGAGGRPGAAGPAGASGTGGAGGAGGGTGARGGIAPLSLQGTLPLFSNMQIEPDDPFLSASQVPLDGSALLAPDGLDALTKLQTSTAPDPQAQSAQDWRNPPGPFAFIPMTDPLQPPNLEVRGQRSEDSKIQAVQSVKTASGADVKGQGPDRKSALAQSKVGPQ